MTELPTGTVTLLFTDIEGSTRLVGALGDDYAGLLARHRAILRAAATANGGVEFGTEGDACFIAFPAAAPALRAAAEAQRGLAEAEWPGGVILRVRMGVHTGTPTVAEGNYVGMDLHRAARICAAAHGGQVLVSAAALAAMSAESGMLVLHDLGHHRLKDLDRPERLYQLAGPDGDEVFPPPRALPPASNLPAAPTSFIGRVTELAELDRMLTDPGVRLLTLTGPGGTGKTRLALEAGRAATSAYPDGVWFVPLAAVADPARVGLEVVEALGLANPDALPSAEVVSAHLRNRVALLILDNFEHVAEAADWIQRVLAGCPRSRLLVTSRILLGLSGEHEYPVRPLALPGPAGPGTSEAVELFAQRAVAVRPHFVLDERNRTDVADICTRLDGLPLAIELAAARLRMLTVAQLRQRLASTLPLLESRARDLPERQRTLRATIDWSYQLLTAGHRTQLQRLAVFEGGCTLDAAEAVAGSGGLDVMDGTETLVEHSLVWRDESLEPTRYRMLGTIREYALEQLERSGELEEVRARHAAWFGDRAREADSKLGDGLAWFDAEMDNLRAALAWTLAASDDEAALELARSVGYVWHTRGLTGEALTWLSGIVGTAGGAGALWSRVLYWYTAFGDRQGGVAVDALREASALLAGDQDATRLAKALNALGEVAYRHGDHDEARQRWEEALALLNGSADPDDRVTAALVTANLATLPGG